MKQLEVAKVNIGEHDKGSRGYWDAEGVILDQPLVCGKCILEMKSEDDHKYKCTCCGAVYVESEDNMS